MPKLIPVTPIPRESTPADALPGRPCPMLSIPVYERRYGVSDLKVCVVLGLENTSSGCSLSRGCRPTLSSVTALCARLGEPLCFCRSRECCPEYVWSVSPVPMGGRSVFLLSCIGGEAKRSLTVVNLVPLTTSSMELVVMGCVTLDVNGIRVRGAGFRRRAD